MNSLAIIWPQYGPYHLARVEALRKAAGTTAVHAIELSNESREYLWRRGAECASVIPLARGAFNEDLGFWRVFLQARRKLAQLKVEICLVPSYWPKQSLAVLLAAKSLGIRSVMMNETHAGTSRARGLAAAFKKTLLGLFDAALVGGAPQKRYFASLGVSADKILTGYDAVDNDYFARRAIEHRRQPSELRARFRLPQRYFLSLGRFVAKKNLETLIRGYRLYVDASPSPATHLVMVGSGPEEPRLKALCRELGLRIYEKKHAAGKRLEHPNGDAVIPESHGVHFYGFQQIDKNAVFYALAEAFILPSLYEEWGLVVNEAMASGLPIVVSQTAGCAEDLLELVTLGEGDPSENDDLKLDTDLKLRARRNGFVFDPNSPSELGRILLRLEKTPKIRETMGQQSRRIIERFSCENFARNALLAARAALGDDQPGSAKIEEAPDRDPLPDLANPSQS